MISHRCTMATKTELEQEIVELKKTIELSNTLNTPNTPKPEKVIKMYWPRPVVTGMGYDPKAFGLPLQQDENGKWFAEVPESRVKAELSRKCLVDGGVFTLDGPAPEEEE